MNLRNRTAAVAAAAALASGATFAERDAALAQAAEKTGEGVRTIRLIQDDAQPRIASKLYELRNAKATDVRPFIEAAVKRYSSASRVGRVFATESESVKTSELVVLVTAEYSAPAKSGKGK